VGFSVNARTRALVTLLALGLVFAMGVHYDTQIDQRSPYPDTSQLASDYDDYVGSEVYINAVVESVDPGGDTIRIEIEHETDSIAVTVENVDVEVQSGSTVHIYGTLEPDRVIAAENVVVVNPSPSALYYKYGVSVVGALLVVVSVLRHWRIDVRELAFEVRSDG